MRSLGQVADRNQFQRHVPEDPRADLENQLSPGGRDYALEGVEEAFLSGIEGLDQDGRNSAYDTRFSIMSHPMKSKGKTD